MKRDIIQIDEKKCNGCGLCINACHEGALQLIDGKARLVSDSYCDGLGNCLPGCPTGAITIIQRDADAFDEEAVKKHLEVKVEEPLACGCAGSHAKTLDKKAPTHAPVAEQKPAFLESQLQQWPCQIKLVPTNAPYLNGANLLIAASCTAYAYANIHQDFMKNKITLIGCPKLDEVDYSEKLSEILKRNDIKSVTVLRMEVPCCGGITHAVKKALLESGRLVPWNVITISTDGTILDN